MKVKTEEELLPIVEHLREEGKVIVFTNGCFDILHVGHVRVLQEAKSLGDVLIVGLNSDTSVRKLKGGGRPIVPEEERAEMLVALECVDYVVIFDEHEPSRIMSVLKPDIQVKGGDYTLEQLEKLTECKLVKSYHGRIHIASHHKDKSTTNIIKKIQEER